MINFQQTNHASVKIARQNGADWNIHVMDQEKKKETETHTQQDTWTGIASDRSLFLEWMNWHRDKCKRGVKRRTFWVPHAFSWQVQHSETVSKKEWMEFYTGIFLIRTRERKKCVISSRYPLRQLINIGHLFRLIQLYWCDKLFMIFSASHKSMQWNFTK